jgi:C-terminal processing protease CtpA/Prc
MKMQISKSALRVLLNGLWVLGLSTLLAACGGGGGGGTDTAASTSIAPSATLANLCAVPRANTADTQGTLEQEKSYLRSFVDETYLWYKDVPSNLVAANYATPQTYFDVLKNPAKTDSGNLVDQFHWSQTTASWDASSAGAAQDYGVQWVRQPSKAQPPQRLLLATAVAAGSPAAIAGVKRGDKLTSVDGVDVLNDKTSAGDAIVKEALYPTQVATHKLGLNGQPEISMTPAKYDVETVQNVEIIPTVTATGKKENVGYFTFDSHIAKSEGELIAAINQLKAANVTDLVIDMRYNGGGLLYIASELAYMVSNPEKTAGKTFEQSTHNDKSTSKNWKYPFYNSSYAKVALPHLDLAHVTLLVTHGTASASESLINSLRGVDVAVDLIGTTTRGKPYGFVPQNNCGSTYFSIQFKGVNQKGFGDYADGFKPTCFAADDLSRARGDTTETMLSTALSYRKTGICPTSPSDYSRAQIPSDADQQGFELVRPPSQEMRILTEKPSI